MAIMFSDVEMRSGLVWRDRWHAQEVSQTTLRTIGGLPVFYYAKLHKGVPVTLESLPDQGWQLYPTVESLQSLAAVPGAQYLLDFGPMQFSVMFRHEDAPAFEARPLLPRTVAGEEDHFLITMKLITV